MSRQKQTFISRVREALKDFTPDTHQFVTSDLFKYFPIHQRKLINGTLRGLVIMGEIKVVSQVSAPTGGKMNIYIVPSEIIKPDRKKYIRKKNPVLSAEELKKLPDVPMEIAHKDIWSDVWPDLYRLPKHMIKKLDKPFNRIVHKQDM